MCEVTIERCLITFHHDIELENNGFSQESKAILKLVTNIFIKLFSSKIYSFSHFPHQL